MQEQLAWAIDVNRLEGDAWQLKRLANNEG
jgi:hypothetical protein